jgi:hypothetical protein
MISAAATMAAAGMSLVRINRRRNRRRQRRIQHALGAKTKPRDDAAS